MMVDRKRKMMDSDYLPDRLTGYRFLDGKGRVNSVSLMQLDKEQKQEGSVHLLKRAGQQRFSTH